MNFSEKRKLLAGKKIRILPYAHCDYAALHSRFWHENRYREIFDSVIRHAENMPEFRWYFDCYRAQLETLFEKYPHKKVHFDRFIKEGKIDFLGAYANVRPNMIGEATYLYNFYIGRELLPHAVCNLYGGEVDVALGHEQIPQILTQFGYDLYKVYRPSDVLDAKNIPSAFIWEGLDKSKIYVVRSDYSAFDRQGTAHVNSKEVAIEYIYDNAQNNIKYTDIDLVWVNCGCDDVPPFITNQANNQGAVYDVELLKVFSYYNGEDGGDIRISSPKEFYQELLSYHSQLKTVSGCLDCADVSYNIAINGEKGFVPLRLRADELLVTAMRWQIFAEHICITLPFDEKAAWKTLLTACSHATQWTFQKDYDRLRSSLEGVVRDLTTYIQKLTDEIAKHINANENTLKTFFNDTQFEGYRTLTITIPCADISTLHLVDGRGETVEFEVLDSHDYLNRWEYILSVKLYLPKFGYNTIRASEGDVRGLYGQRVTPKFHAEKCILPETLTLQGADFTLTFQKGNLIEVNGLKTNSEKCFNALTYYGYDYHGEWSEIPNGYQKKATFTHYKLLKHSEYLLEVELFGEVEGMPITQKIYAVKGEKLLKFNIIIDWKQCNAYLVASIPADSCQHVLRDIPFGRTTVDVAAEYTDELCEQYVAHRRRKGVIFAKRFISAKFQGTALTLLRGNSDRYFLCDLEKKMLATPLINSMIRRENSWEEDINEDVEGVSRHCLQYSVLFDEPTERNVSLATATPFSSDFAQENPINGNLPTFGSFMQYSAESILPICYAKDGDDAVLRLVETEGKTQTLRFTAQGYSKCNAELLNGKLIGEIPVINSEISYTFQPYEIVSLRMKK